MAVMSHRGEMDHCVVFMTVTRLMNRLCQRRQQPLIRYVMGDADDAQRNAWSSLCEGEYTVLMCYFHVVYNVRKRMDRN